jgi:hypothetical protein
MACALCKTRRPRRFCPGAQGDICAICCGTEREVTVSCPLDCEYLLESRRHDRPQPLDPHDLPHRDIEISEDFVEDRSDLIAFLGSEIARAALQISGAVDRDVREALDALVRTYKTLESGVYYESRPTNPLADGIFTAAQAAAAAFRKREQQEAGMTRTRDADVLRALVFLSRVEMDRNNGRPRGRAFLSLLVSMYQGAAAGFVDPAAGEPSGLIIP